MKIDGETKMRMIKKELGVDSDSKRRDKLIDAALSVVILFVPPLIVSTILWQWLG